jgi:hypothetical protein
MEWVGVEPTTSAMFRKTDHCVYDERSIAASNPTFSTFAKDWQKPDKKD